jgi:hypothetical protein
MTIPKPSPELEAFNKKFNENTKYSGRYLETTLHMPCPFCAEPDFLVYKIIDVNEALTAGAVCKHCHRGLKGIFNRSANGLSMQLYQTEGDDPPAFLPAPPRFPKEE